jgi:hypothetical protein
MGQFERSQIIRTDQEASAAWYLVAPRSWIRDPVRDSATHDGRDGTGDFFVFFSLDEARV